MQPDIRPFNNVTSIPANIEEARTELSQVRVDNTLIQAQLAARPRPSGGTPSELREWREWRSRAAGAYQYKSARSQFLNNWIRSQQQEVVRRPTTVAQRKQPMLLNMAVLLDEILGDETDDLSAPALLALREMRAWIKDTRGYVHDEVSNGVAG